MDRQWTYSIGFSVTRHGSTTETATGIIRAENAAMALALLMHQLPPHIAEQLQDLTLIEKRDMDTASGRMGAQ